MTAEICSHITTAAYIGSIYALFAVGYAVAYSTLNVVNFAHGEVFMSGALVSYLLLDAMPHVTNSNMQLLQFGLVLIIGGIVGAAVAWIIQRFLYRPLMNRGRLTLILVALAASLFLQQFAFLILRAHGSGSSERRLPINLPLSVNQGSAIAILLISIVVLWWIIYHTDLGITMRALAYGTTPLKKLKIPFIPILSSSFLVGGVFGGLAGVVYAAQYTVTPFMGFAPGIKAFLACIIGGRGVFGALLGGFIIGCTEGLISSTIGSGARELIVGVLLIALLLIRPEGLLRSSHRRTL